MRRVLATLGTAVLLLAGGCGLNSYEARLNSTLEQMKYEYRLNKMLQPALTKGGFEDMAVYLRPPKDDQMLDTFELTGSEPGKFDLERTLQDKAPDPLKKMHVLVRVKRPKNVKKKTVADTADRTNFARDVLNILTATYSPTDELVITKFKTKTPAKGYEYKSFPFTANDRTVETYLFKKDNYEVALIFEHPKAEAGNLATKIQLCLECFALGDRAKRFFSGSTTDDESAAGGAPSGVAF